MKMCDSRRFLAIGTLVLTLSLMVYGGSVGSISTLVRDVSFDTGGRALRATIAATEPVRFTYFQMASPDRLVLDFRGSAGSVAFTEKPVGRYGVERVRASIVESGNGPVTRLVFDLASGNVKYRVKKSDMRSVEIFFDGPDTLASPVFPAVQPSDPPITLVGGPPVLPPVTIEGSPAAFDPPVRLPVSLEIPQSGESWLMSRTVPLMASLAAPFFGQITTAPPPAGPVLSAPPQGQTFSGELVSLNLVDVDLKDFFLLISDISGLNVILDPNVSGRVSLSLRDAPWDQALDLVLRNNNLGGELQGNVLRIATNATLQAEEGRRAAARDAQNALTPTVTRSYILNYVKSDAVAAMLRTQGAGILSQRGSVISEPRRNAILVTDVPEQFGIIEQMKTFIDVPSQQVEIEARLLSANKSFSREFGSQIGFLLGNNTGNILTGGQGEASPFSRTPAPRATAEGGDGLPLLSNLPAAATSGIAFLLQPGGDILLDAIITAAEASGTAKLISRPKVTTQNNQPATVSQGTKIPVQTNVNNTISVQFLDFSLKLTVTPQITEAGTILLTADIENSQPDFARTVNGIPAISTQQAQTQVLIPDGATAMVGGILVDIDSLNERQVPGLGSIPVIGHLFKNTSTVKSTAELLFFITPRIKASDALVITAPGN